MLVVSGLAVIGGVLVLAVVRDGPYVTPTAPFDPHAIRRIVGTRGARQATFGYLGHMWELYAMWTWVGVFATASFAAAGVANAGASGSLAAFLAIGSGAAGCAMAGYFADRLGKARVAIWAMLASATCAALTTVVFGGVADLALRAGDDLGLCRGRRLGAVLGARERARAARSHRHGADAADLSGIPADDGDDRVSAASRWRHRLALGVATARPRTAAGRACDAAVDAAPAAGNRQPRFDVIS